MAHGRLRGLEESFGVRELVVAQHVHDEQQALGWGLHD
jgi:hypothetical protein